MEYRSETMNWSSVPNTNTGYGSKNIVTLKNGKGVKVKEILNANGQTIGRNVKPLTQMEITIIQKGQFIPGFWDNCGKNRIVTRNGNNKKNKNKNNSTMKNKNKPKNATVRNQTLEKESYWNKWF